MIKKWIFLSAVAFLSLIGCTAHIVQFSSYAPVDLNAKIAVIPFANYTETPLAGERAMSITAAEMESRGIPHLVV